MRLAILLSHPVQYYSPWFRTLAKKEVLTLKVFYLWDSGLVKTKDRSFGKSFAWDIPLLDGYESEFLPNVSRDPGTHHCSGLDNPGAVERIHEWKPDFVLLFGYAWKTHLRVLFSNRLRRIPKVYRGDSHDLFPSRSMSSSFSRLLKRGILRRFTHFFPVGKASRDYLIALGVAESAITIVPHCVDNERFRSFLSKEPEEDCWRARWGIEQDRPVILFVGKWETKKRPLDLLEAFLKASFLSEARHPALVFVGDGELREAMEARAGERKDRDIFLIPFQNQSEIPRVYAAGDLLVLPSFGSGETWGLVVNEAMSLGLPAIVSSHVGCGPDLVLPSETGWTFDAGDVEALSNCLEEAMGDLERLRKLGKKAQEHITGYSYEVAAEALVEEIQDRCEKKSHSG